MTGLGDKRKGADALRQAESAGPNLRLAHHYQQYLP
jgi:hypothetical protein